MQVEYVDFRSRAARSAYIATRFKSLFQGKVLEVGCDKALLKQLLPGLDYVGVDMAGEPDLRLNLERIERLPFDDAAFDCVVCTETLEHLDNLHGTFGELMRVAKKYVIISLPNNWVNARVPIQRGKGSPSKYGLPADPPRDRHKWFFSLSDAMDFIQHQRKRYAVSLRECYATEKPRPLLVRVLRRALYPVQMRYLNRYAHTLWVVLEKP
jgi:2-polyprenyl-3-methyl-5-hydroxy-6-metoxy-1,4-benzoquinol methylase